MAAQAGLCLGWSETPEDTFSQCVAHLLVQKGMVKTDAKVAFNLNSKGPYLLGL